MNVALTDMTVLPRKTLMSKMQKSEKNFDIRAGSRDNLIDETLVNAGYVIPARPESKYRLAGYRLPPV